MRQLELFLFGGFRLIVNGKILNGTVSNKSRALIAYLAMESARSHPRPSLAALLWPGKPERLSLADLRQTLHRQAQALGPHLLITHQDVQFNPASLCQLDTARFDQSLQICRDHHPYNTRLCAICLECLKEAVDLYRGDLLSGVKLTDCPEFEWWLTCRQEEYHIKAMGALRWLISTYELSGDTQQAIELTQQALELEPWGEALHQQMISLYTRSGQRISALRQYETCRKILAKELNVLPADKTTELFNKIRNGIE